MQLSEELLWHLLEGSVIPPLPVSVHIAEINRKIAIYRNYRSIRMTAVQQVVLRHYDSGLAIALPYSRVLCSFDEDTVPAIIVDLERSQGLSHPLATLASPFTYKHVRRLLMLYLAAGFCDAVPLEWKERNGLPMPWDAVMGKGAKPRPNNCVLGWGSGRLK